MNKNKCVKGIVERIVDNNTTKAVNDMTLIGDIMLSKRKGSDTLIGDEMAPLDLLNGAISLLSEYAEDTVNGYSELEDRIKRVILDSDVIHDLAFDKNISVKELGIAIMSIGNRMMTLSNSATKVIKDRMKTGEFCSDDLGAMSDYNLDIIIDSKFTDEIMDYLDNKSNEKYKTSSNPNVKVTDKKALIQLIKDDRISFDILRTIIESGELSMLELMDELDQKQFTHVLSELKKTRESKDADGEENIKKCHCNKECDNHSAKVDNDKINPNPVVEDSFKELLIESLQGLVGKTKKELEECVYDVNNSVNEAMNDDNITVVENICRSRILKGLATDEEILLAIKNNHLNPFFLDGTLKKTDKKRYDKLCIKILEENAPEHADLIRETLEDSLKDLINRLTSK